MFNLISFYNASYKFKKNQYCAYLRLYLLHNTREISILVHGRLQTANTGGLFYHGPRFTKYLKKKNNNVTHNQLEVRTSAAQSPKN